MSFLSGSQPSNTVQVAGMTLPVGSVKILSAVASSAKYDSFRYNSSYYQVPVGKTAKLYMLVSTGSGVLSTCTIGSSTGTANNQPAPPAGYTAKILGGSSNTFCYNDGAIGKRNEILTYFEFSAGEYINIYADNGLNIINAFIVEA